MEQKYMPVDRLESRGSNRSDRCYHGTGVSYLLILRHTTGKECFVSGGLTSAAKANLGNSPVSQR